MSSERTVLQTPTTTLFEAGTRCVFSREEVGTAIQRATRSADNARDSIERSTMITIDGLSDHQVQMLDIMWEIEEIEDLEQWRSTLTPEDVVLSKTLQALIECAAIDDDLEQDYEAKDLARQEIARIASS